MSRHCRQLELSYTVCPVYKKNIVSSEKAHIYAILIEKIFHGLIIYNKSYIALEKNAY